MCSAALAFGSSASRGADLGATRGKEQSGQRPVPILGRDIFNERSGR
jgi:mRNA-degrading endonuclease toxin of MazEF toxin-antitoxin module